MKYGESAFDIIYLVFAIVMGVRILRRGKDAAGKMMGLAVLILGIVFMREQTAMVYIFCIALLYLGLSRILSAFQKTEILEIPQ